MEEAHLTGIVFIGRYVGPVRDFIQRVWGKRWLRGLVYVFGLSFGLVIGLREYVNWSGSRAWADTQAMIGREGETIDLRKIGPAPVPDDQNFCAIPLLKDLAAIPATDGTSEGGLRRKRLVDTLPSPPPGSASSNLPRLGRPEIGTTTDLKPWAELFGKQASSDAAKDLLAALSRDDGIIHEFAAGLNRPESQWTPQLATRPIPDNPMMLALPHLAVGQNLPTMLCLRSIAEARVGDAADAFQSLFIALRFNEADMNDSNMIGTLVGCQNSLAICGAVWELCNRHVGAAEDFRQLQDGLSRLDYRRSMVYAERGELAGGSHTIEYLKRTKDWSFLFSFMSDEEANANHPVPWPFYLIPDGFYDANAAATARWHIEFLLKPVRDEGLLAMLKKSETFPAIHGENSWRHPGELLARLGMGGEQYAIRRAIYAQSMVNQAVAACALERYRIEHNAYPDNLDQANRAGEKSIPLDMVSGKPLRYRKNPDGGYTLWSISFSGKDHGGVRVLDPKDPNHYRFTSPQYTGDWVWECPGK